MNLVVFCVDMETAPVTADSKMAVEERSSVEEPKHDGSSVADKEEIEVPRSPGGKSNEGKVGFGSVLHSRELLETFCN